MKYADVAILTSLSALGQQGRNVRWPSLPRAVDQSTRRCCGCGTDRQTDEQLVLYGYAFHRRNQRDKLITRA